MIEVLVTMVVLALGLLGLAALQTQLLRTSGDAQSLQIAVQHAGDLLERIRANQRNVTGYVISDHSAQCNPNITLAGSIAAVDLALWSNSLGCSLPQARANVTLSGNSVTISITWRERADATADSPRRQRVEIRGEL